MKSLTKKQKAFSQDGYYLEKDVFSSKEMKDIFISFYSICLNCAVRNKIVHNAPSLSEINYPENLKDLDLLLISIIKAKKGLLGEVYDTFAYSMVFMRFLSNKKVESLAKELLRVDNNEALYGFANRMRIDAPSDERRTYGWHQEVYYNLPYSRFIQTWCPIMRSTSIQNGTLKVKKGSHKAGIVKQSWHDYENRVTQIIVDPSITEKYETLSIEMGVGDLLFFDSHLIHKSGHNSTKDEVRFSLVGTWNDVSKKEFRAPLPNFKSRTISFEEYFRKSQNLN